MSLEKIIARIYADVALLRYYEPKRDITILMTYELFGKMSPNIIMPVNNHPTIFSCKIGFIEGKELCWIVGFEGCEKEEIQNGSNV